MSSVNMPRFWATGGVRLSLANWVVSAIVHNFVMIDLSPKINHNYENGTV
jgi:hypothetical protein